MPGAACCANWLRRREFASPQHSRARFWVQLRSLDCSDEECAVVCACGALSSGVGPCDPCTAIPSSLMNTLSRDACSCTGPVRASGPPGPIAHAQVHHAQSNGTHGTLHHCSSAPRPSVVTCSSMHRRSGHSSKKGAPFAPTHACSTVCLGHPCTARARLHAARK